MLSRNQILLLITFILASVGIVLAAVAWARINEFSLPLPAALPAINVLIPLLTAILWPIVRSLTARARKHALQALLPYLAHASKLIPFILLILSLVYAVPSDMQSCAVETQWLRMFRNKDERAIRSIQTRLQCCGFNSVHDRAWPFPSRGVGSDACERTQGYHVACGPGWRQEEMLAAVLTGVASFLNWLFMVWYCSETTEVTLTESRFLW